MKSRVIHLRASPVTFHGLMDAERAIGQSREPDLVLAFLAPGSGLEETLEAMAEVWPASQRVGCEAASQFAEGELLHSGSLQLFWLADRNHEIWVQQVVGDEDRPPGDAVVTALARRLEKADGALLLAAGPAFPTSSFTARLGRELAVPPPFVGGVTCQPQPRAGQSARVFYERQPHPAACLVVGFQGIAMEVVTFSGWQAASPISTATRAADEVLYHVDGQPAVDWYRRWFTVDGELAPLPETAWRFPLLIDGPDPRRRQLCRAMRAFDEPPGAVTFWGDVATGDRIRLGVADAGALLPTPIPPAAGERSEAAILCSGRGREIVRGEQLAADVAALHRELAGTALAGAATFGEIAATRDSLVFNNQTAVLALLNEVDG